MKRTRKHMARQNLDLALNNLRGLSFLELAALRESNEMAMAMAEVGVFDDVLDRDTQVKWARSQKTAFIQACEHNIANINAEQQRRTLN